MISSQFYIISGTATVFASNRHIGSKYQCSVWVQSAVDNIWSNVSYNDFDLVNNSIVLNTPVISSLIKKVELRVADSQSELGTPVTDVTIVANNISDIEKVSNNIDVVTATAELEDELLNIFDNQNMISIVGADLGNNYLFVDDNGSITEQIEVATGDSKIAIVANNINVITNVANNIVDIQNAEENANIAITKASEASTSESNTLSYKDTTQGYMTTTDGYKNTTLGYMTTTEGYKNTTLGYKNDTEAFKDTASTQAGIATTKANEALTSKTNAGISEANALASENKANLWANEDEDVEVETGLYSAKHWTLKAQDLVTNGVIDDTEASELKTYSSAKIEDELLERDTDIATKEDVNIVNSDNIPNLFMGGKRKEWTKGILAHTGMIAIELSGLYNQSSMNGMMNINLLEVGSSKIAKTLVVSGQWNNGTSMWDYGFANDLTGNTALSIRFARDVSNSKVYILLGETSTVWANTRVSIEVPMSSYNSGLNLGFIIGTMSSLSGITVDYTKEVNMTVTTTNDFNLDLGGL